MKFPCIVPFLSLLVACSSDEPTVSIAGTYLGDVVLQHDNSPMSIFTSAELVITGDGDLDGSRISTVGPTAIVGELGAVTGMLSPASPPSYEVELELAFPTLGTFTARGTLVYADLTKALSGNLSARDANGTVVGNTLISVMQE